MKIEQVGLRKEGTKAQTTEEIVVPPLERPLEDDGKKIKELKDFRNKIRSLALSTNSLILKGINVEELRDADMLLFEKFEKIGQLGEEGLTIKEIKERRDTISHFPEGAAKKLLDWMQLQIERGSGVPITIK